MGTVVAALTSPEAAAVPDGDAVHAPDEDVHATTNLETIKECTLFHPFGRFFSNYIVQRRRSQYARTLTPVHTRMQTLPL
jgi:hypothetical protein